MIERIVGRLFLSVTAYLFGKLKDSPTGRYAFKLIIGAPCYDFIKNMTTTAGNNTIIVTHNILWYLDFCGYTGSINADRVKIEVQTTRRAVGWFGHHHGDHSRKVHLGSWPKHHGSSRLPLDLLWLPIGNLRRNCPWFFKYCTPLLESINIFGPVPSGPKHQILRASPMSQP